MDVIRDISTVLKVFGKCRTCGKMVIETELEDGGDCFDCRIKKGNEYWEQQRTGTFNGGAYTGQERGEK